jgi:CheY-like chemotaxis protein
MSVRVLVIDDDDLSREVFALLLNREGYAVDTADSGDAALIQLQNADRRPDVVLADLQMPGTAGTELARQLRAICGPSTRLLAMSASAPDDDSAQIFDALLLKPFTAETFAAALTSSPPSIDKNSGPAQNSQEPIDETVYRKLAESMRPPQLQKLYELCLTDMETRLDTMRRAASADDELTYKKEAHAVKGSCGMVGAKELQTLATSMERHGLSDDHVASLQQFVLACERLRGMLIAREIIHNRAIVSGEDA